MAWLSIDVECEKCLEEYVMIVDREERNEPQFCDKCDGGMAHRVVSALHVSTSTRSESIPDAVAKGRFDELRINRNADREVSKAKAKYAANPTSSNAEDVKRTRTERDNIKKIRR